jgi:hypothetical protein
MPDNILVQAYLVALIDIIYFPDSKFGASQQPTNNYHSYPLHEKGLPDCMKIIY